MLPTLGTQKLDNSHGSVSELQIDLFTLGGIVPMSDENNEKDGSSDGTQAKPTITIAEKQSGTSQAKPTITIAERQGSDQDPDE